MGMEKAIKLRHELHQYPELSGLEVNTARLIARFFEPLHPDETILDLGGTGAAFCFGDSQTGPTVLLRGELDAVPIQELNDMSYKSLSQGISHQCGHDGHMAILASVGMELSRKRPPKGRVVLLYQPAEETGEGAAAVIRDKKFSRIKPDFVFAMHNLPGFPVGQVILRSGIFNCASRGMVIRLIGKTAHAAQPETGTSPARAMCRIINELQNLPSVLKSTDNLAFATVVGARLGEKAFGTAPGDADVMATLRSGSDEIMNRMIQYSERMTAEIASGENLKYDISYEDVFAATVNSKNAVEIIHRAGEGSPIHTADTPFRWSEDFGRFTSIADGALFGIGAGEETPELHHPDYDFPDELVSMGSEIYQRIISECLN